VIHITNQTIFVPLSSESSFI